MLGGRRDEHVHDVKIKSNKVSFVRAHSQGSFLLVNPSIPTSSRSCCVRKFNSYNLTLLLEFESKEICTLTDKNLFT